MFEILLQILLQESLARRARHSSFEVTKIEIVS